MKAKMLLLALVVLMLAPRGTALDDLEPVRVVRIWTSAGETVIETDTGAGGAGKGLTEAVQNMQDSASGVVFLDTAEFLLLPEPIPDAGALTAFFRPACRACIAEGEMDLASAGEYLQIHMPGTQLRDVDAKKKPLQILKFEGERWELANEE